MKWHGFCSHTFLLSSLWTEPYRDWDWVFNRNLMPMFITDWRCDSLPQTIIYVDCCFSHFIFAVKPLFQIEWNSLLKGKPGWISIPVISLLGCFPSACLFPSLGKLKRTVHSFPNIYSSPRRWRAWKGTPQDTPVRENQQERPDIETGI